MSRRAAKWKPAALPLPVAKLKKPTDRRGKLIALTEVGLRVLDDTLTRHVANEERILSTLTIAEQERLDGLLRKLIAGL